MFKDLFKSIDDMMDSFKAPLREFERHVDEIGAEIDRAEKDGADVTIIEERRADGAVTKIIKTVRYRKAK